MGNFRTDTAVTPTGEEGRFTATLDEAWAIWGPAGGYVAGIALRAAGAVSTFDRPASCAVQFLGVARFEPVDLHVEVLKTTRRTQALRVSMTQDDRPILHLTCWALAEDQMDRAHRFGTFDHPPVTEVPTIPERLAAAGLDDDGPPYPFWRNFDQRPLRWLDDWQDRPVMDPVWATWIRYQEDPVTADAWVEAARLLLLVDLGGWPAAQVAYGRDLDGEWYAPSLDVSCQFIDLATSEWLCVEHVSPAGVDGLLSADGRVWAEDGRLVAQGVTQLLATPTRR